MHVHSGIIQDEMELISRRHLSLTEINSLSYNDYRLYLDMLYDELSEEAREERALRLHVREGARGHRAPGGQAHGRGGRTDGRDRPDREYSGARRSEGLVPEGGGGQR